MQICVAGGAQVLDKTGFFNIGQRNYSRFEDLLRSHGLTIQAQAVGGLVSRTIFLKLETGEVRLKTSGTSVHEPLSKTIRSRGRPASLTIEARQTLSTSSASE